MNDIPEQPTTEGLNVEIVCVYVCVYCVDTVLFCEKLMT